MNRTKLGDMTEFYGSLTHSEYATRVIDLLPITNDGGVEWRVEKYWYVLDDSSPFEDVVVEEIVLQLVANNMNASVDLETYLAIIDRQFLQAWILTLDQTTIAISQSVMPFCEFERIGQINVTRTDTHLREQIYSVNMFHNQTNFTNKRYLFVGQFTSRYKIMLRLTKMYLCDQVEFDADDFDLLEENVMHLKDGVEKMFYTDEIRKISWSGGWRYRLCAEDAGFTEVPHSRSDKLQYSIALVTIVLSLNAVMMFFSLMITSLCE